MEHYNKAIKDMEDRNADLSFIATFMSGVFLLLVLLIIAPIP